MPPAYADYQFFIDWDNDGGLRLNDFQNSFEGWQAKGTAPPDLELSEDQALKNTKSLLIQWDNFSPFVFDDEDAGFDEGEFGVDGLEATDNPFTFDDSDLGFDEGEFAAEVDPITIERGYVTFPLNDLLVGKTYRFSLWMYPVGNHAYYQIGSVATSAATTTLDEWQEVAVSFVPNATSYTVTIRTVSTQEEGHKLYVDYMTIRGQFEEVVPQNEFSFSYGRDDSRALSPVNPAETELTFLDLNGRYSPLNQNSELYPNIESGRELQIRATYNGTFYDLFWGLLDDVDLNPATGERSVTFNFVDIMSLFGQTKLNTQVYSGKRTGELIHIILDEIGWPATRRDIDAGATWVDRWWAYDTDASTAISELVASEGLPSYATLAPSGDFVFRDRHHRLLAERSQTVQTTIASIGDEPLFSAEMEVNLGWKDVINSVMLESTPRRGEEYYTTTEDRVWSSQGMILVPPGHTEEVQVVAESPFIQARTPVDNSDPFEDRHGISGGDYTLLAGSVNVYLSRTSGQTTSIFIQNTGVVTAVVKDLSLHAVPVVERDEEKRLVTLKDTESIAASRESTHDLEAPWANINDCQAIAQILLGQRANKLPTISFTLNNGSEERMQQIMERQISDRIYVKEPRSFIDNEFYIEGIEHKVDMAGKHHEVVFSCEQVPVYADSDEENPTPTAFKFGDADAGFDEGVFGYDGVSDADTLFVLDETNLDEGLLAF